MSRVQIRRPGLDRRRRRTDARGPAVAPPEHFESLVQQYATMAHAFEPRPVDDVLRALDIVIGGSAAVLTSPLMGMVALALKVSSPRSPILYRGWRVGRGGHLFQMLKFRTLAPDAEQRLGPYLGQELTLLTEQEVTRIGRVIRVTRLDELPQLYNVLRGDMSLVGPRPIRPAFFSELCVDIPQYWQRLVVRPGLTGLAQLRLRREMTWAEKLAHDMEFIADRSVGLYLSVIATTAWLVIIRPANQRATLHRLP
ncbi:MAG TPA: sugar transferase [Solirubrobacteraceae bacterium]|nr:sugar transferase [Solirubrobacteraceae bacterium]